MSRRARHSFVDAEKRQILEYLQEPDITGLLLQMNEYEANRNPKSENASRLWRKSARQVFTDETNDYHNGALHRRTWDYLTQSLATAPIASIEYALALDARSRLLFHMKLYRECEKDVDRALKMLEKRNELFSLKCDLVFRKIECWAHVVKYVPLALFMQFMTYLFAMPASLSQQKMSLYIKMTQLKTSYITCTSNNNENNQNQQIKLPDANNQRVNASADDDITINYDKDKGFYVQTLRDLKAGEIVCAEYFYATIPMTDDPMVCGNCLATSWTPVPCYGCTMLFCSEKCRDKATTKYHYYECILYNRSELGQNEDYKTKMDVNVRMGLRLFLMARVACGSNEKVVEALSRINLKDHERLLNTWIPKPNIKKCDKFQSYFAMGWKREPCSRPAIINSSVMMLIAAAKYCNLFTNSYFELDKVEDLIKNQEALLVGALILRYSNIARNYSQNFVEPNTMMWMNLVTQEMHFSTDSRSIRGRIIAPSSSFYNHSCYPNVAKVCNDEGQVVYYAMRPISQYDELVTCYDVPYYSTLTRCQRRNALYDAKAFMCNCEACVGDWPSSLPKKSNMIEHIIVEPFVYNQIFLLEVTEQFMKFYSYKAHLEKSNNVKLQRVIRNSLAAAIDKIATMSGSCFYHETIALFYMLRIAFEKTVGAIPKIVPDDCNMSWVAAQLRQIRADHPEDYAPTHAVVPLPIACSSPRRTEVPANNDVFTRRD